jgi:hypothetical protein
MAAAVAGRNEQPAARPEGAVRTLNSRPSAIVAAVPRDSADLAPVIADHPDAYIVALFDVTHARLGPAVARQISPMIELALEVSMSMATARGQPDTLRGRRCLVDHRDEATSPRVGTGHPWSA